MTEHDKDLEDYLRGDTPLSRAYRAASREKAPGHLDESIIAQARAELRRKPSLNRMLAPVALAATVVLGVNLAWNLHESEPVPVPERSAEAVPPATRAPAPVDADTDAAIAPAAPRALAKREPPSAKTQQDPLADHAAQEQERAATEATGGSIAEPARKESKALGRREALSAAPAMARQAEAPAAGAADIESLLAWVRSLEGAAFIVDGEAFTPSQAAVYLRVQWREAGGQVHTAADFVEKCARVSPASGQPYRFRFADGSVRDAADVLHERLASRRD